MLTINLITTLKNVPSLSGVPDNVLLALLAIAGVFAVFIVFMIFLAMTDFIKVEQKEHKAPDSHKLIMDLQNTLIQEMKGTSKQNSLMINLTIVFIAITLIGMIVSILGPAGTIKGLKGMVAGISGMIKGFRGASGK